MTNPTSLVKLDRARQMLAESRTLPEVKQVHDLAEAARMYARAERLGRESQNYAAEIALLASRKAGEILKQLERTPKQSAAKAAGDSEYRRALKDSDTPERTAQRWQQISAIPERDVKSYIENCKLAEQEITASGLLRQAKTQNSTSPTHSSDPSEVQHVQQELKTTCPLIDFRVHKSSFKSVSQRERFDLELRSLTVDELKSACAAVQSSRKREGRVAA